MKRLFIALLFFSGFSARAHQPANGLVHGSVGPYIYGTHDFKRDFHSPLLTGFGVTAEADIDHNGGVEFTMIYMQPLFAIEKSDLVVVERVKRMYIGMGYRHWFNKDFSVAPSFYSSYLMGDAEILRNDFGTPNPPKTSARDTVDYGFDVSLQWEFLRNKHFSVLADTRYSYSVTPKPGEDGNIYGVMLALKFFVQGKQPDDSLED